MELVPYQCVNATTPHRLALLNAAIWIMKMQHYSYKQEHLLFPPPDFPSISTFNSPAPHHTLVNDTHSNAKPLWECCHIAMSQCPMAASHLHWSRSWLTARTCSTAVTPLLSLSCIIIPLTPPLSLLALFGLGTTHSNTQISPPS